MAITKYAECETLDVLYVPSNVGHKRLARLRRQTHRHVFDFSPRPGYIYVRSRAISSRVNDNYDYFPAPEIKAAYRTFIGKPVFVNHHNDDHRRARGVIIDAALHEDINPDGTPDTWAEVLMEVDAVRFPMLAKAVLAGDIARTSMGTDVEKSRCTACDNWAASPVDYCQHIPRAKGMKVYRNNPETGQREAVLVAEECVGLRFFENSLLVETPADPTAYVLGVEDHTLQAVASRREVYRDLAAEGFSSRRDVIDNLEGNQSHGDQTVRTKTHQPPPSADDEAFPVHRTPGTPDGSWKHQEESDHAADAKREQQRQRGELATANLNKETSVNEIIAEVGRRREAMLCSMCNPSHGLPNQFCSSHSHMQKLMTQWGPDSLSGSFIADKVMDGPAFAAAKCGMCGGTEHNTFEHQQWPDRFGGVGGYMASTAARTKQVIKASDLREGDRLDISGKTRIDRLHPNPKPGKVLARTQTTGTRSPSVKEWAADDDVTIWREGAMRALAYGETIAPAEVDTLRDEACPVCGDDENYNGDNCQVCGYQTPPDRFKDPDTDKAKQVDLRQDQHGDQVALDPEGNPLPDQGMGAGTDPFAGPALMADPASKKLECSECGSQFDGQGADTPAGPTTLAPPPADPGAIADPNAEPAVDPTDARALEVTPPQNAEQTVPADPSQSDEQVQQFQAPQPGDPAVQPQAQDPMAQQPAQVPGPADPQAPAPAPAATDPTAAPQAPEDPAKKPEDHAAPDAAPDAPKPEHADHPEHPDAKPEHPDAQPGDKPVDKPEEKHEDAKPGDPADPKAKDDAPKDKGDDGHDLPNKDDQQGNDQKVVENQTCPNCGTGTLIPAKPVDAKEGQEPDSTEVGTNEMDRLKAGMLRSGSAVMIRRKLSRNMNQPNPAQVERSALIKTVQAQQNQIKTLASAVWTLVTALEVQGNPRFASLMKMADDAQNDTPPAMTTDQAKTPTATDSVDNIGAAPAPVNEAVTPDATTDVQSTQVAAPATILDGLQNVTEPVAAAQEVPSGDAAHVETDVRVTPPNNDVMDPAGTTGWTGSIADPVERFTAALQLARLRMAAGLIPQGNDILAAQQITAEAGLSLDSIRAEARGLAAGVQSQATTQGGQQVAPRHLVPRAAAAAPAPSLAGGAPAPLMAHQSGLAVGDDEFVFGAESEMNFSD